MSGAKDGGFLARWSRRKQEAREEEIAPASIDADAGSDRDRQIAQPQEETLDEKSLAERLAQLPRIEEIGELTDMRVFMQPWVPENIRGQALRKLWTVDRAVREHEIFADYALDYNTPGAAPGYGALRTTAEMAARALGEFSRDPAEKVAPKPVSGEASPKGQADSPVARKPAEVADADPASVRANEPMIMADVGAAAPAAPNAVDEKSAASREEAVPAQPLAFARRRHGSAAPR